MSAVTKYAYIDIVRGIAILAVVLVHVGSILPGLSAVPVALYTYGSLGVQLFFVASALTLCMSMKSRSEDNWTNFYIRRFFRIAPLFYCGIVFYFFWHLLVNYYETGALALSEGDTLLALFQNVFFLHGFSPSNFNYLVPGAWSIGAEVAFYALFPLVFMVVRKGIVPLLTLLAVTWAVSLGVQIVLFNVVSPYLLANGHIFEPWSNYEFTFFYANIFNQLPVFLVGCVCFLLIEVKIGRTHLAVAGLLCFASLLLMTFAPLATNFNGAIFPTLSAIGFGIGVLWLANQKIVHNAVTRWLVHIGQLSFAIYISHFAVVSVLHYTIVRMELEQLVSPVLLLVPLFLIATYVSANIAQLAHILIEQPGIGIGKTIIAHRAQRSLLEISTASGNAAPAANSAPNP